MAASRGSPSGDQRKPPASPQTRPAAGTGASLHGAVQWRRNEDSHYQPFARSSRPTISRLPLAVLQLTPAKPPQAVAAPFVRAGPLRDAIPVFSMTQGVLNPVEFFSTTRTGHSKGTSNGSGGSSFTG